MSPTYVSVIFVHHISLIFACYMHTHVCGICMLHICDVCVLHLYTCLWCCLQVLHKLRTTYCPSVFAHTVGADSSDLSSLLSELRVNEEERRRKASQSYVSCGPTTTDVRDGVVVTVSSVNVCMYRRTYILCVCRLSCIVLYGHNSTEIMGSVYVCTGLHTFVCVILVV